MSSKPLSRQNFASILKSLRKGSNSKTILHPINESSLEEQLSTASSLESVVPNETFTVKRTTVTFQAEKSPQLLALTEELAKIKFNRTPLVTPPQQQQQQQQCQPPQHSSSPTIKHELNTSRHSPSQIKISLTTMASEIPTINNHESVVEHQHQSQYKPTVGIINSKSNVETKAKPMYFPQQQQHQHQPQQVQQHHMIKSLTHESIPQTAPRQRSSKLIKLNKKVIILPYASTFDDYSLSSLSTHKAKKISRSPSMKNTINHFFPKLITKAPSDPSLLHTSVDTSRHIYKKYDYPQHATTDTTGDHQLLSERNHTTNDYSGLLSNEINAALTTTTTTTTKQTAPLLNHYGSTIRLTEPTSSLSMSSTDTDYYDVYKDNTALSANTIIENTTTVNSRRLPFLDQIYVKPSFGYYERRFFR